MRAGGSALFAGFLAFALIPTVSSAASSPGVMITPAGIVTLPDTDQPETCYRARDGGLFIRQGQTPSVCRDGSWRTLQIEEAPR